VLNELIIMSQMMIDLVDYQSNKSGNPQTSLTQIANNLNSHLAFCSTLKANIHDYITSLNNNNPEDIQVNQNKQIIKIPIQQLKNKKLQKRASKLVDFIHNSVAYLTIVVFQVKVDEFELTKSQRVRGEIKVLLDEFSKTGEPKIS
jgi:ribosomal protein L31E